MNKKLLCQIGFALMVYFAVNDFRTGSPILGSLDVAVALYYFLCVYPLSRVPGGFKIGRLELYITSVHEKGSTQKFFQFDDCPGGCKLTSVGRIGFTILGKECFPGDEE